VALHTISAAFYSFERFDRILGSMVGDRLQPREERAVRAGFEVVDIAKRLHECLLDDVIDADNSLDRRR
jgi:hypothetical protein